MFKIISDGGCDFSRREAEQHGVGLVPFYINIGNEHFKEGVDISKDEYFERLLSDKSLRPKTAQPNPQDYIDEIAPQLTAGWDVLLITISSKLSGSHNSAQLAIEMLKEEFPDRKVMLIDSQNASIGQGLILRELIKMRDAGFSLHEAVNMAEEVKKTTRLYFTLDTLEYLKRGGRVGPTTALVGGILGLRPILQLDEGEISQLDNVRGKKKALKLIEEAMVAALQDEADKINLSVGHILCEKEATAFAANTEQALNIEISSPITSVGAAIGTHAGPGAMAFAYCKKYEALELGQKEGAA